MFSYLRIYLLPLSLLLFVALAEKGLFVLYHAEQFSGLGLANILYALLWGIRFDLAIVGAFAFSAFLAAYLLHRLLRIRFTNGLRYTGFIAAAVLLLLHGADLLYYDEAGRHLGYELKETINSGADLATASLQTYTIPVALQLLLLVPLYLLNRFLFRRFASSHEGNLSRQPARPRLQAELALVILLLPSTLMVRGGLVSVPLQPLHAHELGDSQSATIALNGAYNAVFSSITPYSITPVFAQPPAETEIEQVRGMFADIQPVAGGEAKPWNVIMILLESWSGAYQQPYGYGRQTTPFYDELRQRSLTTVATTAGGHRTTEGIFATMCSWQNPLGKTVAQSQLQDYQYRCLPEILNDHEYHTAFFQGTLKNTSGTGAFAQLLGFRHSYGKKDVREQRYPHNSWGLQDPDLYSFTLEKLKEMPQPFFIGINTNSTHSSELPPGVTPHFSGDDKETTYLNTLHFSDSALRDFIQAVENSPAFKDTLFVLVADHAGPSLGSGNLNKYLIPFLIYAPGLVEPHQLDVVSSQRDIAPTLLSLLQIDEKTAFSGRSLLDSNAHHYADYYHQGVLGWIEGKRGIEFRLGETPEMRCYSLAETPFRQQPDDCRENDQGMRDRAQAFTHLSQALLFSGKTRAFSQLQENK